MNSLRKALRKATDKMSDEKLELELIKIVTEKIKDIFEDDESIGIILDKVLNDIIRKELWNEIVQFKVRIGKSIDSIVRNEIDIRKILEEKEDKETNTFNILINKIDRMKAILEEE